MISFSSCISSSATHFLWQRFFFQAPPCPCLCTFLRSTNDMDRRRRKRGYSFYLQVCIHSQGLLQIWVELMGEEIRESIAKSYNNSWNEYISQHNQQGSAEKSYQFSQRKKRNSTLMLGSAIFQISHFHKTYYLKIKSLCPAFNGCLEEKS